MNSSEIGIILEAILLCADQPLEVSELKKILSSQQQLSSEQVLRELHSLQQQWQDRGLNLIHASGGWRFQSSPLVQGYIESLTQERPPKYSRAVLETLAIIAWKQPVTRGDIEAIRGVSVSSNIIRTLEERGWIEVTGYRDAPGRPALLATTKQFLSDLSIGSLDDLPDVASLQQQEDTSAPQADPGH